MRNRRWGRRRTEEEGLAEGRLAAVAGGAPWMCGIGEEEWCGAPSGVGEESCGKSTGWGQGFGYSTAEGGRDFGGNDNSIPMVNSVAAKQVESGIRK